MTGTAKAPRSKKRVLFVCVENSNRSQMAEAFARRLGGDAVDAWSAGSRPSQINPKAIRAMAERGYDLATHTSKSLQEIEGQTFDAVITMGCGDACPWVPSSLHEDWALADPRDLDETGYRSARDEIEKRVSELLAKLA